MTRVLVTGGSGFIGRHLVSALIAEGNAVRILDLRPPAHALREAEFVRGSVLDPQAVKDALDGVAEVYHLAGLPGMWTPRKGDFATVNEHGTAAILEAAEQRGVSRFLHCSTELILYPRISAENILTEATMTGSEDMPGLYTHSKKAAEDRALAAAASGFHIVIGIPTMPIGLHDYDLTPPTAMLRYFIQRRVRMFLDFVLNLVDVRDVASGLILVMNQGQPGERYILGGENLTLKSLLERIGNRDAVSIPIAGGIARTVASLMEFVADHVTHRPPSATVEAVEIALRARPLSCEKSRRELGYRPRSIGIALQETIAWLERDAIAP